MDSVAGLKPFIVSFKPRDTGPEGFVLLEVLVLVTNERNAWNTAIDVSAKNGVQVSAWDLMDVRPA